MIFGRRRSPAARLGRRGERYAARWLRRRGYRILHRNLVRGRSEADLVVESPDGSTIVLVEVKTRSTGHAPPSAAIGRVKRTQMLRLAGLLAARGPYRGRRFRLDAIAIVWPRDGKPRLEHYPGGVG